jgi:hypothetical protein
MRWCAACTTSSSLWSHPRTNGLCHVPTDPATRACGTTSPHSTTAVLPRLLCDAYTLLFGAMCGRRLVDDPRIWNNVRSSRARRFDMVCWDLCIDLCCFRKVLEICSFQVQAVGISGPGPRENGIGTRIPAPLFGEIYRREGVGRLVVRLQKRNDRIYFVLAGLDLLWIANW